MIRRTVRRASFLIGLTSLIPMCPPRWREPQKKGLSVENPLSTREDNQGFTQRHQGGNPGALVLA